MLKHLAKRVIGEGNLGRIDHYRLQHVQHSWGGPFNGQKFRQRIFFDLLYSFPISAIVETGTYRGTTTALFAATCLHVYGVEIHPRYYAYARWRFYANRGSIHLHRSDSPTFLRKLSNDSSVAKDDVFFYLDAHWQEDLPLREELEIIFTHWKRPIVMIDDFQVPDSEYAYDDYGPGKSLDLHYIEPILSAHKLSAFFPSANSSAETGMRRGCVVLCQEMAAREIRANVKTLVQHVVKRKV